MLSFQGQIKPELHPEWSPLGFHANFLKGIHLFDIGYPPPLSWVNVNELSVLLKLMQKEAYCVIPENIHTPPPPRMVNRNS